MLSGVRRELPKRRNAKPVISPRRTAPRPPQGMVATRVFKEYRQAWRETDRVSKHQLPSRLLIPFTHGVDMEALDSAMVLAKACHTTLVAVAIIRVKAKRPEPRLEHIMQAKDFLEAVYWRATRQGVQIERFEVVTEDVVQSLDVLTRQLSCNGVALFVRKGQGVLLNTDEMLGYLERIDCTGYLVHLQAQSIPWLDSLRKWFSRCLSWLPGRLFSPDGELAIPPSLELSGIVMPDESKQEEDYVEGVIEDQRIHSNG